MFFSPTAKGMVTCPTVERTFVLPVDFCMDRGETESVPPIYVITNIYSNELKIHASETSLSLATSLLAASLSSLSAVAPKKLSTCGKSTINRAVPIRNIG